MFGQTFEIHENLSKLQENFINKIFQENPSPEVTQSASNEFLNAILHHGHDVCELGFGDFGSRLHETVSEVDFDHPEVISGKFLASFNKEDENYEKLIQYLNLCALSKEHKLDQISGLLAKCIAKTLMPNIKSSVDLIKNQQQFVRLFKQPEERERLRAIKAIKTIELSNDYTKLSTLWQLSPSLESYARFENCYAEQINTLHKKINIYSQLGLTDMSDELITSLKDFESLVDTSYYGFQRIPMTTVAILLAKMHECSLQEPEIVGMGVSGNQAKIIVNSKIFKGYNFEHTENQYVFVQHDGANVGLPRKVADFNYKPSAYPLHTLEAPDRVKAAINHLDAFPDANGKPIFDHYIVIVPGIAFPRKMYDASAFVDTKGELKHFPDQFATKTALDSILIKERFIVPAVVGEKDGKCYFICLFS